MTRPEASREEDARSAVTFDVEAPTTADALALMHALVRDLLVRYDDDAWEGDVVPSGCTPPEGTFLVVRSAGRPVACGGFRPFGEAGVAELKRMYVDPGARGAGVARTLLERLERMAAVAGYRVMRLEAGTRQPEALRLYERCGYRDAPSGWGTWAEDPNSVFLEKELAPTTEPDR